MKKTELISLIREEYNLFKEAKKDKEKDKEEEDVKDEVDDEDELDREEEDWEGDIVADFEDDDLGGGVEGIEVFQDAETEVGGVSGEVQDNLEAALEAAKGLGDEELIKQIGNTLTFFTRQHVVKEEEIKEFEGPMISGENELIQAIQKLGKKSKPFLKKLEKLLQDIGSGAGHALRTEGHYSDSELEKRIKKIGYDSFEYFFADNPGGEEALLRWIDEYFPEDEDYDGDESEELYENKRMLRIAGIIK